MYDLTQPLSEAIPRIPGDPEVRIEAIHNVAPWQISSLAMGTHSGTHMDAPRHRIAGGRGIGAYGPDRLVGRGLVLDVPGLGENEAIPATVLNHMHGMTWAGWFAVVRTGWDRYWGGERYFHHPHLSPELAQALVQTKAGIVAIDALSVDSTADSGANVHAILLGADILIAENLCNLGQLGLGRQYMFAFLPLSLGAADGSPSRVVAWESQD